MKELAIGQIDIWAIINQLIKKHAGNNRINLDWQFAKTYLYF